MGRRLLGLAFGCTLILVGVACGGDGVDPFPTALPTAESIDPDVLSQALLRDGDLPEGFTTESSIGSPSDVGVLATSISRNGTIEIHVGVIWMPTTFDAEGSLARQRRVWVGFGWSERNDEVEGTDAAFRYTKPQSGLIELIIDGQFVVSVRMTPSDPTAFEPASEDTAEFERLNALIVERMLAIQADLGTPVASEATP